MNADAVIRAPFGRLALYLRDDALVRVKFASDSTPLRSPKTAAARRVCARLRAYFKNPRIDFGLALAPEGTPFQLQIWRALRRIPVGQVLTYGTLAQRAGSSARAVGNACRRNPIPVVVPCHRVVAANGDGGFMGKRGGNALAIKRWLLAHEQGG